ncbi:hypothetical protein K449DRAFT_429318 [Hypoxylon sp. EC38]|nr:hypothetical protein K449DRAFT_429318 [Hypoxylon sp. EC38]
MSGSDITQPIREVVLHRSNIAPEDLYLEEYAELRDMMSAWEWEMHLFSSQLLDYLREQPCYSALDGRLIIITNDWLNRIQELWNREIRSPKRQVSYQRPYTFAGLFNLVYKLQQLVYLYHWGDSETVRTPDHHRTFWPRTPRSDVTQARFVIATLAKLGFGAWLEDMPTNPSQTPKASMIFDFHFNCHTRTLSWANINETGLDSPRIKLHLVFPEQDDQPEDEREFESAEYLREFNSFIFSWLWNIPDDETLLPDEVMSETHSYEGLSRTSVASSEITYADIDSWSDEDGDEDQGWTYDEVDDDDDDYNNDNDNDNHTIHNDDDFYHSFGGYDNRRNWDNGGYIPFYGHPYDDPFNGNDDNNNRDSSYRDSLNFSVSLSDSGHDDGVFTDNTSDSGYSSSVNNDNGTNTDPFADQDQPSDNGPDSFSSTDETIVNVDEENEAYVAAHQPDTESAIGITSDDNETSTTLTNNDYYYNHQVHDRFLEALDRPLEGDLGHMWAYVRYRARQRQHLARREHEPWGGDSDTSTM